MKIDRLLGIVIYLLNHSTVNARVLAEKFEVSQRTIQRDIETLGLAGIPVSSIHGVNGGYSIVNGYKINNRILNIEDYVQILTALKGLCSAYENKHVEATFEKLVSLLPVDESFQQHIYLDFSVLREGFYVREYLSNIETAIRRRVTIEFEYTNAEYYKSQRKVEPIIATYKWYAWYLLGYCCDKQDYRMFRLSRIRNLKLTCRCFSKIHENAEELLAQMQDRRQYLHIKLLFQPDIRIAIEESFPNSRITETDNNESIIEFSVPENERGWFGTLLGFGCKVTVLEPEKLKLMLIEHTKEIINKYC